MEDDWKDIADAYDEQAEPTQLAEPVDDSHAEPTVYHQHGLTEPVDSPASRRPPSPMLFAAGGAGLLVLCLIGVLVGVLILRPASTSVGLSCETVDPTTPSIVNTDTGLTVLLGEGERARACLGSIDRVAFLQEDAARGFTGARSSLPGFLNLISPVYVVETRGSGAVTVEIPVPEEANTERLDLYSWDAESEKWVFIPSVYNAQRQVLTNQAAASNIAVFESQASTPLITTVLEQGEVLDDAQATLLNIVFPAGLTLRPDGAIDGQIAGGWSLGEGYAVVPLVRAEAETVNALLADPAAQTIHIEDLVSIITSTETNGIALNYSGIDTPNREAFSAFVADLSSALSEEGKLLVVIAPAPTYTGATWRTAGYDWASLGQTADLVAMDAGATPQDFSVEGPAYEALSYVTGMVPRQRLLFMTNATSVQMTTETMTPIAYTEAITQLGEVRSEDTIEDNVDEGTELRFQLDGDFSNFAPDQSTGAYTFTNADGEQVWVITANTVRARLDIASEQGIAGMMILNMVGEGTDQALPTAVSEFKARNASSIPTQITMRWTVTNAGETVFTETLDVGSPFVWQPTEAGDYEIRGEVVGSRTIERGSVAVKVGQAATPEPTAQPTTPSQTNNQPDAPTATPPPAEDPTNTPPPSVGGSGGDGGPFETGAQVPNAMVHVDKMQSAGMNWVKFQMKYGQVGSDAAASYVAAGRGAGFKVLISVTGVPYPDNIDYAGAVQYMGQVASYQPDAIEVWNEQNYVFEWPAGQIDGKAYVDNLLAPSFNAIKSASPNTLVIIGAPTPTGVNDPNIAIADNIYIEQMAAAGAAQYANCLGVHYNAGATSAYAREGHPGGGHHSWYYQPSLEVYYNAIGGALPLCITEIGYVTDEGFDTNVPDNFAWAANTTVAQQAQWLGEAKTIARDKGYVRMMIVFNVGFTTWTATDPQGGYSIVRPDGSCPACAALAGS